jgi:hypothetical protein
VPETRFKRAAAVLGLIEEKARLEEGLTVEEAKKLFDKLKVGISSASTTPYWVFLLWVMRA